MDTPSGGIGARLIETWYTVHHVQARRLDCEYCRRPYVYLVGENLTGDATVGIGQTRDARVRAQPGVRAVRFVGDARPTQTVLDAIRGAELIVIGPSNPYVSVDPILTLPGVREAMAGKHVVAVSPIVGGKAVKGPLAEMIPALSGQPASAAAIAAHYAKHYGELLSGMVIERGDEAGLAPLRVLATGTVMTTRSERTRLARELLAFSRMLGPR
jgi:LPPG:FO 2-phospho-L-lactate transferase